MHVEYILVVYKIQSFCFLHIFTELFHNGFSWLIRMKCSYFLLVLKDTIENFYIHVTLC